jgi:hypothetical protein
MAPASISELTSIANLGGIDWHVSLSVRRRLNRLLAREWRYRETLRSGQLRLSAQ